MSDDRRYLTGETDAQVWAESFMALQTEPSAWPPDTDLMVTWFANAIQSGEDVGRSKAESDAIQRIGMFSTILATMTEAWAGRGPDWMLQPPDFLTLWESLAVLLVDSEGPVYRDQADAATRILDLIDPKRTNVPLIKWWADLDRKATVWEAGRSSAEVTKT